MVEDPSQGHLDHGHTGRKPLLEHIHELDTFFERQTGKCFAHIEGLAVAVEMAVVAFRELCIPGELSRQQTTGKRKSNDNAHPPGPGLGQKLADELLPENIEDDLKRKKAFLLKTDKPFLHGLDAGAEVPDQALLLDATQPIKNLPITKDIGRDTVKLQQVKGIHSQSFEGGIHRASQRVFGVFVGIHLLAAAELGCHHHRPCALPDEPSDEFLAPACPINIGGIEKGDATFHRGGQDGKGSVLRQGRTPFAAELPAPQADVPYLKSVLPEQSCFH